MKVLYFLLLAIFFTSFQNLHAQTEESFITIKKKNETYFVSGVVINEIIKNEIVETLKKAAAAANVNASELKIDSNVGLPAYKWEQNLEKHIAKVKNSKTAFFQIRFTREDSFPEMPAEILNSEILLTRNNEKINLNKYRNDTVILSLVAHWARPVQTTVATLNQLYDENLQNVKIIAVNVDEKGFEDSRFLKFVEKMQIKFQTGWTNKTFTENLLKISKFNGIPQTFMIKDGRLRGVFVGSGPKVNETLIKTARKTSEENLSSSK